jgi:mRNA interferase MazF
MPGYELYDVVVVPFPFTDRATSKKRPALVISSAAKFNGRVDHIVLAMITSARHSAWPLDVVIEDLAAAGLPGRSVVRMKLFTLDGRLVLRKVGRLADADATNVAHALRQLLPAHGS